MMETCNIQLHRFTYEHQPPIFEDQVRELLEMRAQEIPGQSAREPKDFDEMYLVVNHDDVNYLGKPVVLGLCFVTHFPERKGTYINRLFVHPDARQKFIGSALVDGVIKMCGENNRVSGYVKRDNSAAVKLFQKFGFVNQGPLHDAAEYDWWLKEGV